MEDDDKPYALFREDGCEWLVKVVSDVSDDTRRTVRLEMVRELHTGIYAAFKPGVQWEVWAAHGALAYVGWSVIELPLEAVQQLARAGAGCAS